MKRSDLAVFVGNRIKTERKNKKMSQEALAYESGIHPSYFGCIERGEKCPTVDTLFKISAALGVPVGELLTEPEPDTSARSRTEKRISYAVKNIPDDKLDDAAVLIEKLAGLLD